MKNLILLCLFIFLIGFAPGCYLLETKTNSSGKEVTNLETILDKVQPGIKAASPIINTFVPGVGTIASLIGTGIGLMGGLVTSIVVAHKRGGTLAAVIKGVEVANNDSTKEAIKEIAGTLGYEPYLNSQVKKITGT